MCCVILDLVIHYYYSVYAYFEFVFLFSVFFVVTFFFVIFMSYCSDIPVYFIFLVKNQHIFHQIKLISRQHF